MEKEDMDFEMDVMPARSRRKKSKIKQLKIRLKYFWFKMKQSVHVKKKVKNEVTVDAQENDAPLSKKIIVVSVNLLGMAALLFLVPYCTLKWLDGYTGHGVEYTVPSVHDKGLEEAAEILEGNKLGYKVLKYEYREGVAMDVVLKMYPDSGSVVKEGRKIGLVLSTTEKPKRKIPSVIDNRTFREAESHIKAAGFTIQKVQTIDGEKDWVYSVIYKGKPLANGDAIPEGSSVIVVIGNGNRTDRDDNPEFDSQYGI